MKLKVTLVLMLVTLIGCASDGVDKQKVASIKTELANIDAEISAAEKANEQYAGGLVKALVTSRIEILKQTRAMLQQRDRAWTFGIKINYRVDGKPFVLPAGAKELLPEIEKELADNKGKIDEQEKTVALYSGGLVQALSISTLETMKQTQALLDQRRLAIKYELPQYLGFQNRD
jgi:hypothetical protein